MLGTLTEDELAKLWRIFQAIGQTWNTTWGDSREKRSNWLELVTVRCKTLPSYYVEYRSAIAVMDELVGIFGEAQAFDQLFFDNGLDDANKDTALAHLKTFVVDEFIMVHLVAGGGYPYGARNYRGYIGGSRFQSRPIVRALKE